MKAKFLYLAMMSLAVTFGLTACSDDDDDNKTDDSKFAPIEVQKANLTFDADTLIVGVQETATLNITNGGGDYKVISENPDIATASLSGNAITVTSLQKGKTGLLISDADGNYKRIPVKSMYRTISVDKDNVSVGIKLGHTDGQANVTVTAGNGDYKAVSADENVAKINGINGNVVTIGAVNQGTTTVTITDMMGLTKTINVTVETTTVPYTDDERTDITNTTGNYFTLDGKSSYQWGSFGANVENGKQHVYYNYSNYYYCHVYFDGDLTVGKKTGGSLRYKFDWNSQETNVDNADIEILKNDGSRVWGIMSYVQDNYLHYGYFCAPI